MTIIDGRTLPWRLFNRAAFTALAELDAAIRDAEV